MFETSKQDNQVNKKIHAFDTKLKTSFILIRQDLDDMQTRIDAMRKYLKQKDIEHENQNSQILKSQKQIQEDIAEFNQGLTRLKLAISQISAIKQEVVIRKDLSNIEYRIKESFAKEIEKYKSETISLKEELKESNKRITTLEKKAIHTPKKFWFKK
ncbi:hypothetical protein J4226_01475 [Candidatus Pacearchaeota archaeon]|nr:hypothetical protein [Candidatus Pacearchaeota archaeon]